MFDILEADIVVLQETKIQRKDLSDDMVLVPGWDCYFSLPRYKKGYSGVAIYTRQSVCAPIRAEEGITGISCPPNSFTSYSDLSTEQQIGGYPTPAQLSVSAVDAATLDSEGRCVILEFPAFVLVGVYSPANRDETRDDYRLGFLNALDARIRNLDAMGKRILLAGDLNISREEIDAANAEASMRKQGLAGLEFVSTPARRLFNQLLQEGKVFGDRDEGREHPAMWDICRAFHPNRKGMFTCWEQKVNARPANCGSRIDYVLCSLTMKEWFSDSNIQEALMGSDHCPVYATLKDTVGIEGQQHDIRDVMNPSGMFIEGRRQREYRNSSDLLALSGRQIPDFSGRRNIRDMFSQKPSLPQSKICGLGEVELAANASASIEIKASEIRASPLNCEVANLACLSPPPSSSKKRSNRDSVAVPVTKRSKSSSTPAAPASALKGQQSLKGFFKPKGGQHSGFLDTGGADDDELFVNEKTLAPTPTPAANFADTTARSEPEKSQNSIVTSSAHLAESASGQNDATGGDTSTTSSQASASTPAKSSNIVHDPVESKESWSKLFTKPIAPRCEGHDEPCICLLTKKSGMNVGRSFWMCPRPLGPSGAKERNTQWRCQTFIWCSDWNSRAVTAR